jgi:hypothetical protein
MAALNPPTLTTPDQALALQPEQRLANRGP